MGFLSFFKSIKNRVTGKSKKNSESGSASGATAPSGDAAPRSTTSSRRQQESKKTSQPRSKATPRSSAQLSVAAPTTAQASAVSNLRISSEQTDVQHSLHHTSSLPSSAVNRSLFADAVVTPTSERLQPSLPCTPKSSSAGVLEMSPSLSIDLSNSGSSSVVGGSMEESGRGPPQLVSVEKLVPTSPAQPPPAAPKLISAPKSARTSWCAPPPSPTEEDASLAHRRGRQYSELLKKCRDDVRSVIVESYALSRPPKAAPQSCSSPAAQTSLFHQARLIRQAELSRVMMQDTRGEDERAGGAQSSVRSPLSDEVSPSSVHSASICFESDEHSEEVVGGEDVAITDPRGGATNTVRTIDVSDEPSRGVQSPPMLSSQTHSDEVLDGIRRSEASLNPSSDDDGADVDDNETLRSWTNLPSPTVPLSEGEMQLLHEIDAKVVALGTRIQRHDEELCRDKDSREYWRRLYHANNTRQSEQRAEWSRQYDYLKEMRQKVVRGVLQQEAQREIRRRRREKQQLQRRDCVYNRLYNKRPQQPETAHPSPREKSKSPRPRQRRPAHDDPPVHDRLYTMGIGLMQRQEEQRQRAEAARQHQEWEDWMVVRLEAQMRHQQVYARGAVSRRTVEEREHIAREQIRQAVAVGGEKEAMKLLKTSEKERAEICEAAERLSHFGAVDAGKREEKRRAKEMAGCTFTPRVNDSLPGQARSTQHACDELYTRAVEQRKRKEQQLELVERAQKIDLLRSRMETDHHFRTRVQLDPSLAERYVMGLE